MPFKLHHPVYADDLTFRWDRHVVGVTLPDPGTEEQFWKFCSSLAERPFDLRHPLWQVIVVDGLPGGAQVVVVRLHHCLIDGVSMLRMFTIVFGRDQPPPPGVERRRLGRPVPPLSRPPGRITLVANALSDHVRTTPRLPYLAKRLYTSFTAHSRYLKETTVELPAPPDGVAHTPFNNAFGRAQVLCVADLPLDDLLTVKEAGGTDAQ